MRAAIQTTIIRDREGYEVRDFGEPASDPSATLAGQPPSGIYIVGKSGTNDRFLISTEQNLQLWRKACRLNSPQEVAEFMGRWGQISRWLTDDGSRSYKESYLLLEPHLQAIKQLAVFVDAGDKSGFSSSLVGNRLLDRANIAIDVNQQDAPLIIEAPSLLRFMIIEMWNEFGGERPTKLGFRNCRHCGRQFQIGGRRHTTGRRIDAQFCSDSCRNMASRMRVKSKQKAAITPPLSVAVRRPRDACGYPKIQKPQSDPRRQSPK